MEETETKQEKGRCKSSRKSWPKSRRLTRLPKTPVRLKKRTETSRCLIMRNIISTEGTIMKGICMYTWPLC